jgi:hypothetical protein
MLARRMLHCRLVIGLLLRRTRSCVPLTRIFYLFSSLRTGGNKRKWSHPAQAKFVICDCTIENRLHRRRDVTLGEDRCGVRFPPVAQMLAVLNTVVLSLMDFHRVANVARQIRRFSSHPDEALAWTLDF